jgi:hypothetical protein
MDCLITSNVSGICPKCGEFTRTMHVQDDGMDVGITCELCCVVCHPPNAPHAESLGAVPIGEQVALFEEGY